MIDNKTNYSSKTSVESENKDIICNDCGEAVKENISTDLANMLIKELKSIPCREAKGYCDYLMVVGGFNFNHNFDIK
jgi:hypothetical protein